MTLLPLLLALAQGPVGPLDVEPSALTRDPALVGREVVVDDRILFYSSSGRRTPQGLLIFDELRLRRTDVIFRLPPGLRTERPAHPPAARVTAVVRVDGTLVYGDVTAVEPMPADHDRLDRAARRLGPGDADGRLAWADWASRRARDFKDAALAARGRELEAEALLIESERPRADDLALARRAREHGLGDDLAGAFAHRGLRVRLGAARTADEFGKVVGEIESYLPRSTEPRAGTCPSDIQLRLAKSPIATYRGANDETRALLDRALLTQALSAWFDRRLADAPERAMALADEARTRLPDHLEVANRLREVGLKATEAKATTMRLSEVEALVKDLRDGGQPDRARAVLKAWLDEQRKGLNPSDADGHVILAGQYDRLLGDRPAVAELLRGALKADPESKGTLDALRRMGFRKSDKGEWYDPSAKLAAAPADEAPARGRGDSLLGKSPEQVRAELGKPDRVAREATQDATVEEWTYQQGRGRQVIVIHRHRGQSRAEVVAAYSLR